MSDERVTAEQRRTVITRANGCCEYCCSQVQFATQSFSVEHIVPRYKDGKTILDNLALSCQGCNSHKYTKMDGLDPFTQQKVPLFHPRQQAWIEHFTWSADFALVIGLTPTGRATVEELHLNRIGLINLRRALFVFGQHPPKTSQIQDESPS